MRFAKVTNIGIGIGTGIGTGTTIGTSTGSTSTSTSSVTQGFREDVVGLDFPQGAGLVSDHDDSAAGTDGAARTTGLSNRGIGTGVDRGSI